jgi:HD-GYP domain-containing protein (c-di-GMP phosphodiesterase class II)
MQYIQLEALKHHLRVGVPLPFNVHQSDHKLLLARGQIVGSTLQLEALFERGMLVDIAELETARERILKAPRKQLPTIWDRAVDKAGQALLVLPSDGFEAVVEEVAQPLVALVERDPDLAIFQVLRRHGNGHTQYGVTHAIHCAIAVFLTAHRLGMAAPDVQRAFKAALTMNVSMFELQGELATQAGPLTAAQREAIHAHPQRSVQMLQVAGVSDAEWLEAVSHHHESSDGSGYPDGLREVTRLAALLQHCDMYTAKLSPRRSREALTADVAARRLFAANPDSPMAAALIKEFGLYPPGCFVKLKSGETGIVVRRGASAHAPQVAAMTDARGASLAEPVTRDTAQPAYAIVSALGAGCARLPLAQGALAPDKLLAAVCA